MPTNTLIQLPSFSYTNLDFETIIADCKQLIDEHPEYNRNWNSFLESDAGRMFIEMMSYIIEKLSGKVDWNAQELFLSSATQRQSLINLLRLINHTPALPVAAKVNIKGKITKWSESFQLPLREQIIGIDTKGNSIRFECIQNASDGKPDYSYQYTFNTGTESNKIYEFYNIPFYQGTTYTEDSVFAEGIDNEEYNLEYYPVIESSIRLFLYETGVECPEVDSFVSPEAQQADLTKAERTPPYMVKIDAANKATIVWGSSSLVETPTRGSRFKIMYRVGGGANTNIISGGINTTKTYSLANDAKVSVVFNNPDAGFGGADEEDIEQAKLTAPISLRSANKTVTREDYITHLESSQHVMHAHIIGKENEPDDIYLEYGYYLPPLETWIYICPNRENWSSYNPKLYNKILKIDRPYNTHKILDSETITITNTLQMVYLKKLKKYLGYNLYIIPENNLTAEPYIYDRDFVINELTCSLTRISTAEGGSIPTGDQNLLVYYVEESAQDFYVNTVKTFDSDNNIYLDTVANGVYPAQPIVITSKNGTVYSLTSDYTVGYAANRVTRSAVGAISGDETVFVQYANNWMHDDEDDSEESLILDTIKNKKMICVDNLIKDSIYTPYDVVATIYCYKNLRSNVETNLKNEIREKYNLKNSSFATKISKSKLMSDIMNVNGVRYVDINYLGKNYEAYRRHVLGTLSFDDLVEMDANKVDSNIDAKYNEMLVLANDEFEGNSTIVEYQRCGLIFTYKDA